MPVYPTELHSAANDGGVQAIIDTAQRAVDPKPVEPGSIYLVATASGDVKTVDLFDAHRETPARKTGTTVVRDAASFATLWHKHSNDASEVYADADKLTVTAILNADSTTTADWADHRLRLELRETDAWKQWAANDGELLDQEAFANFIEDHLPEILTPAAAEMLEIAQSISGTVKAEFTSGTRLATGQRQLSYVETVQAKAGQKNNLVIPETFIVGLLPFEGLTEGYQLGARLRYRIQGTSLTIGYKLDRPADVRKKAFEDVVAQVDAEIEQPILNGTPAGH